MNQTESSIEKDDEADDDDDEMLLGLSVKCYVGVEPAGERYKLCDLSRGLRTCYIKYDMCKLDIMWRGSTTFSSSSWWGGGSRLFLQGEDVPPAVRGPRDGRYHGEILLL